MKRLIDHHLLAWKSNPYRKSLIVRGARQVGKTYAFRQLGKTFEQFIEINFETFPKFIEIFEEDLDPRRIIREIAASLNIKPLIPGKSFLFFDEVQAAPKAIIALRYFYEMLPELHVAAAGSLLDFAIQQVGLPVGRVQSLYMHPVSFIEYLSALDEKSIIKTIFDHDIKQEMSKILHDKLLRLLAQYFATGGMPEAIQMWINTQDLLQCATSHQSLLSSYRQDFYKYTKQQQIQYVTTLFENLPSQLSKKFKYSEVEGDYRSRELSPALDLLCTANVTQKVWHSTGNGIPLGAQKDLRDFKVILVDIGLSQALLGLQLNNWILNAETSLVNKGEFVEAFVGQEFLAYTNPIYYPELYYWHRHKANGSAEVDYLVQRNEHIIPVEVKGGKGSTLKSIHLFLESHPKSPYGIRFSTQNYSVYEKINSYPLYAIVQTCLDQQRSAFESLIE